MTSDSLCSTVVPVNTASKIVAGRVHTMQRTFLKHGELIVLFFTPRASWDHG